MLAQAWGTRWFSFQGTQASQESLNSLLFLHAGHWANAFDLPTRLQIWLLQNFHSSGLPVRRCSWCNWSTSVLIDSLKQAKPQPVLPWGNTSCARFECPRMSPPYLTFGIIHMPLTFGLPTLTVPSQMSFCISWSLLHMWPFNSLIAWWSLLNSADMEHGEPQANVLLETSLTSHWRTLYNSWQWIPPTILIDETRHSSSHVILCEQELQKGYCMLLQPLHAITDYKREGGVSKFERKCLQLSVSMRQAYADEVLVGLAGVAIPLTTSFSPKISEVIDSLDNSLVEEHVDVPGHDADAAADGYDIQEKAANNDAEATEDAEAIEQLRSFLDGTDREKATPLMTFSLASNCVPNSSIRIFGSVKSSTQWKLASNVPFLSIALYECCPYVLGSIVNTLGLSEWIHQPGFVYLIHPDSMNVYLPLFNFAYGLQLTWRRQCLTLGLWMNTALPQIVCNFLQLPHLETSLWSMWVPQQTILLNPQKAQQEQRAGLWSPRLMQI